ncbi:MAG: hypothetical protein WCC26_18415 [Terracidiphilus sp.]
MSALYVSPALLVELDRIGFAANLLAPLFAVFVVIDPPYSGPRRTLEEPAWVLRCILWLWHSISLDCAYFVGFKLNPSPPKQAPSRGA